MKAIKQLFSPFILFLLISLSSCAASYQQQAYCGEFRPDDLKTVKPQYVAVNQGKLEYYRFGTGSPVVLIPGYATDVTSWNREFLASLAEHHDVIVFNNRLVGGSQIASTNYDTKTLAQDTYQLIQGLNLHKPSVLGVSMGGMIAQKLAVMHPHKIGHLILINTAIGGDQAVHPQPEVEKTMMSLSSNSLQRYWHAVNLLFPPQSRFQMAMTLINDRFIPQEYTEINREQVVPLQKHLIVDWTHDNTIAKQLAHLSMPVLILNGREDEIIPPQNSDILKATIPHAQMVVWQEGGHGMIHQFPEQIAQAVDKFLA